MFLFSNRFEEALIFKDPSVTLPYWDSTMDFNMDVDDPIDSVIWSDIFIGNGDGLVTSGPFANWRTTNNALLERNIGSPGSLMTPDGVAAVLSQTFHRDITQPTATGLNDLEGLHNNVHAWIAGNMNGLITSAYDPVFFLHHCYIDYVWEQFRFQQFSRGINPQNDFPNTGVDGHWPWSTMVNLGRIRNVDGYHNAFTQFVYEYESSPTCPDCGNSPYLECDSTRQVCVSTTARAVQSGGSRVQNRMNFGAPVASLMRNSQGMPFRANSRARTVNAVEEKFIPTFIDPRTRKNAGRVKRAVYNPKLAAAKARLRLSTPNNNVLLTSRVSSNDPFSSSSVTISTPFGSIKSSVSNRVNPSLNFKIPSRRGQGPPFRSGLPNMGSVSSNSGRVLSASRQSPFHTRGTGIRTRPTNTRSNTRSMNSIDTNSITRSQGISDDFRVSHRSRFLDFAIQNSFCLDGVPDVSRWAFAPIKIIYVRPPGSSFNCKIIKEGRIVQGQDFYSPTHYSDLQQQVRTGNPASYEKPVRSGSGASKVFVQSDGLSYEGKYIDYAIIDERQPISETVTYVAFKNPKLGASKAYISAYDANGRICQPRCLVHGSNPPRYKECSGVISVTDSLPRMYGNTYGEAVMNRYSFDDHKCPINKDDDIYLTFYCDYENQWPWINYPHH